MISCTEHLMNDGGRMSWLNHVAQRMRDMHRLKRP